MYKNKYINHVVQLIVFACIGFFALISCNNEDELNTDILASKKTTINAYGPNPALRGQKLSIVGTQLDKISKVILPNNIEVTDIQVVSEKLIQIILPQETTAGIVKLIDNKGNEYSFTTTLTISEPIEISKMSPQPVKPGQLLTLEGNYFNLIDKVILSDKVEILKTDFLVHERTKIEFIVPAEAQTGVMTLQNSDEIPLEYTSTQILNVTLPKVEKVEDLTQRKPGDKISIRGKDFDLVTKVTMPNGAEVEYEVENEVLSFTLPENVSDGVIMMFPASGVEVPIAHIGIAVPQNITVSPKSNLRAGDLITIKGENMELVTGITFKGEEAIIAPESKTNNELIVRFPEMAQSGEMVLRTASQKNVQIEVETQKPNVSSFSANPIYGGQTLSLFGTNLDLITSVILEEKLEVEVTTTNHQKLDFEVPLNAKSGRLILKMKNNETVETENLEINSPEFAFFPSPPGPKAEIHAGGVLTVQVENGNKITQVQINGVSVNYIHDNPNLYIEIPSNAKGPTELKLISSNGLAIYQIPVIGSGIVETVIYEGDLYALNWSEGLRLSKPGFENVPAGATLKIYMAESPAGASIAYSDANWTKFNIDDPNFDAQWGTISVPEGSTNYEIELSAEMLNGIMTVDDGWSDTGLMLTGEGVIVSKISIIVGSEPEETTIYEGNLPLDWGDNILRVYKEDLEGLKNGSIIKIYFTPDGSPSFAVQDANWTKIRFENDPNFDSQWESITVPQNETTYELVLTSEILDTVMSVDDGWSTTAIIISGDDMLITKVTVIK